MDTTHGLGNDTVSGGSKNRGALIFHDAVLSKGLAIAFDLRQRLILVALIVGAIEVVGASLQYFFPLPEKHRLLLALVIFGAEAWGLSSIGSLVAGRIREKDEKFSTIALFSISRLPKVLISYIVVAFLMSIALNFARPLLFVVMFLIWAPVFVVGEGLVPPAPVSKSSRERDGDSPWDDESPAGYGARFRDDDRLRLFEQRSMLDFGLARSVGLASRFFGTTLLIVLVVCVCNFFPVATIRLLLPETFGFVGTAFEIFAVSIGDAFSNSLAISTFFLLIPVFARRELSIPDTYGQLAAEDAGSGRNTARFGLSREKIVFVGLAITCAASSAYIQWDNDRRFDWPVDLESTVVSAEVEDQTLAVTLRLGDDSRKYRWLALPALSVQLDKTPDAAKPNTNADGGPITDTENKAIPLSRVVIRNPHNETLSPSHFAPTDGPLDITLVFDIHGEFVKSTSSTPVATDGTSKPTTEVAPLCKGRVLYRPWAYVQKENLGKEIAKFDCVVGAAARASQLQDGIQDGVQDGVQSGSLAWNVERELRSLVGLADDASDASYHRSQGFASTGE